jgi:CHASE3 domain
MCSKQKPARGHFALSGQELLLVHYRTARETVFVDENALRHLTADNLSQQRRLDVLEPQVRTALEFGESIIAKHQKLGAYGGGSDALEIEGLISAVPSAYRPQQSVCGRRPLLSNGLSEVG